MKHVVLTMTYHLLVPDDFQSNLEIMENVDLENDEEIDVFIKEVEAYDSAFKFRGHKLEPHMVWLEIKTDEDFIKANTINAIDDICLDELEYESEIKCEIMEPRFSRINYDDDSDDDPEIYSDEERQNINIEEELDKNDMTNWDLFVEDEEDEEDEDEEFENED